MAVKYEIVGDRIRLNKSALDIQKFVRLAEEECKNTKARLADAVSKGLDADGRPLKEYSDSYKEAIQAGKVRGGTRRRGVFKHSTETNLTISGDLIRAAKVKKLLNGAQVVFLGRHYSKLSAKKLAAILHAKGFTNWHRFGIEDKKRMDKRMVEFALDAVINALEIEREI